MSNRTGYKDFFKSELKEVQNTLGDIEPNDSWRVKREKILKASRQVVVVSNPTAFFSKYYEEEINATVVRTKQDIANTISGEISCPRCKSPYKVVHSDVFEKVLFCQNEACNAPSITKKTKAAKTVQVASIIGGLAAFMKMR